MAKIFLRRSDVKHQRIPSQATAVPVKRGRDAPKLTLWKFVQLLFRNLNANTRLGFAKPLFGRLKYEITAIYCEISGLLTIRHEACNPACEAVDFDDLASSLLSPFRQRSHRTSLS